MKSFIEAAKAPSAGAVLALSQAASIPLPRRHRHGRSARSAAIAGRRSRALEIMLFDRAGQLLARHQG